MKRSELVEKSTRGAGGKRIKRGREGGTMIS